MTQLDVVFTFSIETLDDAIDREFCRPPDQTLLALAGDDRIGRLLVADAWRSLPISLARRRPHRLSEPVDVAGRPAVRVRPHRLRRVDSTRRASVEKAYRRYAGQIGRSLAVAQGTVEPIPESAALITYHPFVAAYCQAPWIRNVVFIARDDWTTALPEKPWWDLYRDCYRRIDKRKADMFAVSAELAERISPRVRVAPNGVRADLWNTRREAPTRISQLPRPRAVYAGTLDDRLDRSLVEDVARDVGSLVMIGWPGGADTTHWLQSVPNVHVLGPVGQQELVATMQACDVGILPHRDTPTTRAMSPLKLYEYLAAGLPVVSVDLPPVRDVDPRVLICSPDQWGPGMRRGLSMGRATEEERLRFIDGASWEVRNRPILDAALT